MKFHKNMVPATNLDLQTLQKTAYERFKLWWMIQHGYTAADLLAKYSDYWGEVESDEEGMYDFWQFLEDTGFNGECWPCFNEFLKVEFRDVSMMYQILNHEEYNVYLLNIKEIIVGNHT